MIRAFSLPILAATLTHGQISFGPSQEISDAISTGIGFAKATDMDGDGDIDVIATESMAVRVLWWANDGSGNFGNQREWVWGDLTSEVIGIDDWNGDGLPDVWIETYQPTPDLPDYDFLVAVNQGDGSFKEPMVIGSAIDSYLSNGETMVIDINEDNKPDIISRGSLFVSNASGTLSNSGETSLADTWFDRTNLRTLDLESDGDTDFLVSDVNFSNQLVLVRNEGESGFSDPEVLFETEETFSITAHCVAESGSETRVFLIERGYSAFGTQSILRAFVLEPQGILTQAGELILPKTRKLRGQTMDYSWSHINSSSDGQIFVSSYSGNSREGVYENQVHELLNNGSFYLRLISTNVGISFGIEPDTTDFDIDGFSDLFLPLSESGGGVVATIDKILWHKGEPGGRFAQSGNEILQGLPQILIHGKADIDGNGCLDLITRQSRYRSGDLKRNSTMKFWMNHGDSSTLTPTELPYSGDAIEILKIVDITGPAGEWSEASGNTGRSWPEGKLDFLVQTFTERADNRTDLLRYEWIFQGENGDFHSWRVYEETHEDGLLKQYLADWDGDGTEDLLNLKDFSLYGLPQSFLRWNRASGMKFESAEFLAFLSTPESSLGPVDLDRDGDMDFVSNYFLNFESPSVWFENDGNGLISAIRGLPFSGMSQAPDLDDDGFLDFISGNSIVLSRPNLDFEVNPFPGGIILGDFRLRFHDLDSDGDFDYVYPTAERSILGFHHIYWQENTGDLFERPWPFPQDSRISEREYWANRRQSTLIDIDNDGTQDLIVASSGFPRLEWFKITHTPEPAPFTAAMETLGLSGHSAGPFSDWDLDGVLNWDEFAFGSNAAVPDPHHPGRPKLSQNATGTTYTFQRRTDAAALGLSYDTKHSANLLDWDPWTPTSTTSPQSGDYERVEYPVTFGLEKEFFKVDVSDPPAP
ncbi:FG-GAP repeat domain-containing protein [Haloferula sp.]|uniref:FG-GAP repeat domain-containing protein n=1 Tax=Haloferula sp. TaxID=2497595 RepID=UPI003C74BE04